MVPNSPNPLNSPTAPNYLNTRHILYGGGGSELAEPSELFTTHFCILLSVEGGSELSEPSELSELGREGVLNSPNPPNSPNYLNTLFFILQGGSELSELSELY